MKKMSRFLGIVLLLTLLITAACTNNQGIDTESGVKFPYLITDDANRTVTINTIPERIISFSPAHTETLMAFGLGNKIVGIDDWSNYPAETEKIPKVGDTFSPNYEVIMSLEPDLVLTVGSEDTPLVTRLEELGINTVVLQAESLEDALNDMMMIARICGAEEIASSIMAELNTRIDAVAAAVASIPEEEKVTVFYEVSPPGVWGLWTVGPDSFIHDLIVTAGGINVSADTPGDYFSYSEEVLIEKDPEIIITPNPETPPEITAGNRLSWSKISAVQNDRVYLVETDQISRPGPRIVNALEDIAKYLYPDKF